jgi:hypothetical protein
MGVRDQREGQ